MLYLEMMLILERELIYPHASSFLRYEHLFLLEQGFEWYEVQTFLLEIQHNFWVIQHNDITELQVFAAFRIVTLEATS